MASGTQGWQFSKTGAREWVWVYADPRGGSTSESRPFPTLLDCINDAALHGYDRTAGSRFERPPGPPE